MSTLCWRLPTARLEFARTARCLQRAAGALAVLLLFYGVLLVGSVPTGAPLSLASAPTLLLFCPALAVVLILHAALRRYSRLHAGLVLLFDGRHWYGVNGEAVAIEAAYSAPLMLAAKVDIGGRRHRLLLLRGEVDRETWRRIRLALGADLPAEDAISRGPAAG